MYRSAKILVVVLLFIAAACAEVPKEVVELSYVMGKNLDAVHQSYRRLIKDRFQDFRRQRLDYLNRRWTPKFIHGWVDKGRLVDVAKGKVIWSTEMRKFVSPDSTRAEQQMLATVNFWSRTAIKKIEEKKVSLLKPLDADEKELLTAVDDAFARLHIANATITAHLNSLRKVKEVQAEALEALDLKDFRDKINDMLIAASKEAIKGLEAIEKADGLLNKL